MAWSTNERPLDSSTRSEEGGEHHSKRLAPSISNLQNRETNGSPEHSTLDDIGQVVREEIEQAIRNLKELIESCVQNAFMGIIPQIDSSLKNAFQEHVRKGADHPIPHSFKPVTRTLPNSTQITDTRNLQLRFNSEFPPFVHTITPLKSQLECPILVELIDANTGMVVTSGPKSCAKLDVVVLHGDFNREDGNTLSVKDFKECMVKPRDGKQPVLTVKQPLKLKEGNGDLGDLTFTDNSSWTRSGKFRIGVNVASGFCEGIQVSKAITEALTVKERRGEAFKKHHPPKSDDDIWRLDEIAKVGPYCKKFNGAGINKAEDVVRILVGDRKKLEEILDGMSKKRLETLEDHAKTCVSDGKSYVYWDDMKDFGVVINNICHFQGFITGVFYHPAEQLPRHQEARAGDLVKAASMNWKHVKVFDPGNYPCSKLGKSLPTSPIELFKEQHLCGSPSDRHLTPLSFPKTQSSEIPWGISPPMSDTTAGLGNGNHNHGVGINPQSSTQWHITNSTASVGSEQDTNRWNQQEASGPDNVQSTVPHESSAF